MCPVKTETISLNVPRAEGVFWRKLAFNLKEKSRGHFQKRLLLHGLLSIAPNAARKLAKIRREYGVFESLVSLPKRMGQRIKARRQKYRLKKQLRRQEKLKAIAA